MFKAVLEGDRLAVHFQFVPGALAVWYQREQDFEPRAGTRWEEQAAVSYVRGAAALVAGRITPVDIPTISMGDLEIVIRDANVTSVRVTYHECGLGPGRFRRRPTTEAVYAFALATPHLAAAFAEAAAAIRAEVDRAAAAGGA